MSKVLDVLLSGTARNVAAKPEEKEVEILRLSREVGAPVAFRLRGLSYDQVTELKSLNDMDLKICLAGIVEPDLGSVELARHYGVLQEGEQWGARGVTRGDLLKALLQPGEISDLSRVLQKMSGYLKNTVKEVKKN